MDKLKIIASPRNWIDSRSVDTLKQIAEFEGVSSVVGLPDLSVGVVPNGMAVMTNGRIYPHLIGSDIGCGMALFQSEINAKRFKVEKAQKELTRIDSLEDVEVDDEHLGYHLGTIGRGNHFGEFGMVEEIKSAALFEQLGLDRDALYLLVHSGSRAFGQIVFDRVAGSYNPSHGISHDDATEYLASHDEAIAKAKHSRAVIAKKLFGVIKSQQELKLVTDTAHNSITKCEEGWLHRKGATPTQEGAVIIAGSRGTLSYLVMPKDDTKSSNYSLSHGAGRKWERKSSEAKLRDRYTKSDLERTKLGSRVVYKEKSLLYEEAPEAYKNIDIVIDDLVEAGLIDVVASFRPLLTFKE